MNRVLKDLSNTALSITEVEKPWNFKKSRFCKQMIYIFSDHINLNSCHPKTADNWASDTQELNLAFVKFQGFSTSEDLIIDTNMLFNETEYPALIMYLTIN